MLLTKAQMQSLKTPMFSNTRSYQTIVTRYDKC